MFMDILDFRNNHIWNTIHLPRKNSLGNGQDLAILLCDIVNNSFSDVI